MERRRFSFLFGFGVDQQRLSNRVIRMKHVTGSLVVDLAKETEFHAGNAQAIDRFARDVFGYVLGEIRFVREDLLCGIAKLK